MLIAELKLGDGEMNEREQRGMLIAATCRLDRKGAAWLVPSSTGNGKYTVIPDEETPHCTCLDHETRGCVCKHIFAVRFAMKREHNADGSVTTTQTMMITEKKPTYAQKWPAYNRAQVNEKSQFRHLLRDLCKGIIEPPQVMGRPRMPLADAVFSAAYKVYSTVSGRRFMTDLTEAFDAGFISRKPSYNYISTFLESEEATPLLKAMIMESALPLKAVEVDFAVDGSGFTSSRFHRWYDHKYGGVRQQHEWCKIHLMCGVKTNVVTAVQILDKDASSTPLLPELVATTAQNFTIREVSGDKEFGSYRNYDAIEAVGATPFIPFKSIHTGRGDGLWAQMFHYFHFKREEFCQHYHKRSNVESTFSMIKAKFGDSVRSRTDVAMRNEALCKVLCHNICCLIQEMHELGIEPEFWNSKN